MGKYLITSKSVSTRNQSIKIMVPFALFSHPIEILPSPPRRAHPGRHDTALLPPPPLRSFCLTLKPPGDRVKVPLTIFCVSHLVMDACAHHPARHLVNVLISQNDY